MVQRLRQLLELAGYEIQVEPGIYGGYHLVNGRFFPVNDLQLDELDALAEAYQTISTLDYPFINKKFKRAYEKVIGNHRYDARQLRIIETKYINIDTKVLEQFMSILESSIANRQVVMIDYYNNKKYEFEPYEVFRIDIAYYVIGYQRYNDVRIFKLDRINNIKNNNKTFIRDEKFSLDAYISAYGFKIDKPVILKGLIKDRKYLNEVIISDYQTMTELENGVYFEIKFYNQARLKRFILEQGSQLEVIEPIEMRHFQKEEALKVLKQFDL